MKINHAVIIILVVMFAACSNEEESTSTPMPGNKQMSTEKSTDAATTAQESRSMDEGSGMVTQTPTSAVPETKQPVREETGDMDGQGGVLSKAAALKLANKSGCLACHSVEKKVVGPAWQDVGARYKGETGIKAKLIEKVKKGGKGNWTEVTGGVPMPPYSPRVPDEAIDKLVTFVLSLPQ
jgi:cytochrome c